MRRQAFPKNKQSDKTFQLKAHSKDREKLKNIQKELDLSNEPDTISHLIENFKKSQLAFKELKEAKKRIAELEKIDNAIESKPSDNQKQYLTVFEFRQQMEDFKNSFLSEVETNPAIKNESKKPEKLDTDWSQITNQELWSPNKKYRGGSIEKIERSFESICQYNELKIAGQHPKVAITNQSLRALSGVNGLNVKEWMEDNKEEILSHHKKHGLLNEKNPKLLETYHNKKIPLKKLLDVIEESILKI